jgi:hypothetical protein
MYQVWLKLLQAFQSCVGTYIPTNTHTSISIHYIYICHMCTKFGWNCSRRSRVMLEHTCTHTHTHTHTSIYIYIYRVSQRNVPDFGRVFLMVIYRYSPKHLCPKLNGYGDNGQRKVWSSVGTTHCSYQLTSLNQCLSFSEVWCYVSASYSWVMYSIWSPNDKNDMRAGFTLV